MTLLTLAVILQPGTAQPPAPIGHCAVVAASIQPKDAAACIRRESYARAPESGSANAVAREVAAFCRPLIAAAAPQGTVQKEARLRSLTAEARRQAFYRVVQARAGRCLP